MFNYEDFDITSETIYRKLSKDEMYQIIQSLFFKKTYNYIFNSFVDCVYLGEDEFKKIFSIPKSFPIDDINRGKTLKKSIKE